MENKSFEGGRVAKKKIWKKNFKKVRMKNPMKIFLKSFWKSL